MVLGLVLLFSGCLDIFSTDGPIVPRGTEPSLWVATSGEPWIAVTTGCGMCLGGPEVPEAETIVVYDSGDVLWYRFGFGSTRNGSQVDMVEGLEQWQSEIAEVAKHIEAWHSAKRELLVHELAVSRIHDEDWDSIRERLVSFEQSVEDPGDPDYGCDDCSGYYVDLLGEKRLAAVLAQTDPEYPDHGNHRESDAWDRLLQQMRAISDWVKQWVIPQGS